MTLKSQLDKAIIESDLAHYRLRAAMMATSAPNLIIDNIMSSPTPMVYYKLKEGTFWMVGRYFAEMLGYEPIDLTDLKIVSFIHPDDVAATSEAMAYASKGLPPRGFCNRYKHKNGHFIWTYWHPALESQDKIFGPAYCSKITNPPNGLKAGFATAEMERRYSLL